MNYEFGREWTAGDFEFLKLIQISLKIKVIQNGFNLNPRTNFL